MIKEYSTLCQCNHRLRPYSSTYKKIESMKKCRLHQTIFQKYKKQSGKIPLLFMTFVMNVLFSIHLNIHVMEEDVITIVCIVYRVS